MRAQRLLLWLYKQARFAAAGLKTTVLACKIQFLPSQARQQQRQLRLPRRAGLGEYRLEMVARRAFANRKAPRDIPQGSPLPQTICNPGIGTLAPKSKKPSWAEYGMRVGYKVTDHVMLDAFANGVSGNQGTGARVHVGADLRWQF